MSRIVLTVYEDWSKISNSEFNGNERNILVCADDDYKSFPVRMAQHIIHYSLPSELTKFLKRFEAIFGSCELLLNEQMAQRGAVGGSDSSDKVTSHLCLTDANYQSSVEIFDFILKRVSIDTNWNEIANVSTGFSIFR